MAIFSTSSSFVRYFVLGDLPEPFNELFTENIKKYTFNDIEEGGENEKSIGWVSLGKIMGNRNAMSDFLRQNYIAMSMRVDVKKVPGQILKTMCLQEEMKIKEATKRDQLSSPEKKEIRENVRQKLIRRTFPTTSMFDFCWNILEKKLFFSSSNDTACADFEALFFDTFGLQLRSSFPYTVALGFDMPEEKMKMVDETYPCDFRTSEAC